jgi:hypothetical protein
MPEGLSLPKGVKLGAQGVGFGAKGEAYLALVPADVGNLGWFF